LPKIELLKWSWDFLSTLEKIIVQKIVKFSKQAKLIVKKTGKSSGTKSKIMCQNWTWMCVLHCKLQTQSWDQFGMNI
jgi:hypothetical protein